MDDKSAITAFFILNNLDRNMGEIFGIFQFNAQPEFY